MTAPLNNTEEKKEEKGKESRGGGDLNCTLLARSYERERKRLTLRDGTHWESLGKKVMMGESLGLAHQPV